MMNKNHFIHVKSLDATYFVRQMSGKKNYFLL